MLSEYASAYKTSSTIKDTKFIDPAPGIYNCKCIKGEHSTIAKNERDLEKFAWTLEIIDGENAGMIFQRVEFLSDPEKAETKLSYIKGALERCGITPPADVRDLPLAMGRCKGAKIEVSVVDSGIKSKEGKTIKNIKFTKSIEFAQECAPDQTDDNPFAPSAYDNVLY